LVHFLYWLIVGSTAICGRRLKGARPPMGGLRGRRGGWQWWEYVGREKGREMKLKSAGRAC
jgi:hypothetical protein